MARIPTRDDPNRAAQIVTENEIERQTLIANLTDLPAGADNAQITAKINEIIGVLRGR